MKMLFVSCCSVVLLLSLLSPINAACSSSSKNTCSKTGTVCAELGKTNMCKKFKNECEMDATNCILQNAQYDTVNDRVCQGFIVGQGGLCDPDPDANSPLVKICRVSADDCNTTSNVCTKFGTINIYRKFANRCRMQEVNCRVTNIKYALVGSQFCQGLYVNDQKIVRASNGK